jgi:hypothetical protein
MQPNTPVTSAIACCLHAATRGDTPGRAACKLQVAAAGRGQQGRAGRVHAASSVDFPHDMAASRAWPTVVSL